MFPLLDTKLGSCTMVLAARPSIKLFTLASRYVLTIFLCEGNIVVIISEFLEFNLNKFFFQVENCKPGPLSDAKCEHIYGYEKSESVACLSSISEIRDKIPEGSTTIFAFIDDRKKNCQSTYIHGSYRKCITSKIYRVCKARLIRDLILRKRI